MHPQDFAFIERYLADALPEEIRTHYGDAPPPADDVARALVSDLAPILGHVYAERSAYDRFAGFVRLAEDGTPYPLTGTEARRLVIGLVERLTAAIAELAASGVRSGSDRRAAEREAKARRRRFVSRTETALRSIRTSLARGGPYANIIMRSLREDSDLRVSDDVRESAALDWLSSAFPRRQRGTRRSEVWNRYKRANRPGAYGRSDLFDMIEDTNPGIHRILAGYDVIDLDRLAVPPTAATDAAA